MTLLAAYGFGAGSGSTVADDSGNGCTLTLGSASWTASGHTGPGITNTAANSTGASTSTMPAVTGTACTLMCWVNSLDLATGTTHFVCGAVETNGNTDFAIFTQRGGFGTANVVQGDVRVGGLVAVNGTAALTVGTWTHVALTFDGSNMRLYVNGSLVTTVANAGTLSNATTFYIAGANSSAALDTDVVVDDVRYYNETLDATAITSAMNTPVGAAPSDLTLTDASAGSVRQGNASTSLASGIVLLDVISGVRAGSTSATLARGVVLADAAGSVRAGTLAGETATIAMSLADPSPGGARLGGASSTLVRGVVLTDIPAGARLASTAATLATSLVRFDVAGALRLGGTSTTLTIGSGTEFFVCQDFGGTAFVESYGGTARVLAYAGSSSVDALAGSALIDSYGGDAANCGR